MSTARRGERGGIFFRLVFLLFLACFAFVIYLARHPLMRVAGNFCVVDDGAAPSEAIVILGDDNYQGDRATRAAELLKAGWAPRIIASGRYLRPYASIAQLEQLDLLDRGVPASDIVLLAHRAENTREEAEAIAQFISAHGWKRILVVTSNYHTRRARFILARVLPAGTDLRVIPASDSEYDPGNWWRTRAGTKLFFREMGGMVVAMWELRHQEPRTADTGSSWPDLGGATAPRGGAVSTAPRRSSRVGESIFGRPGRVDGVVSFRHQRAPGAFTGYSAYTMVLFTAE